MPTPPEKEVKLLPCPVCEGSLERHNSALLWCRICDIRAPDSVFNKIRNSVEFVSAQDAPPPQPTPSQDYCVLCEKKFTIKDTIDIRFGITLHSACWKQWKAKWQPTPSPQDWIKEASEEIWTTMGFAAKHEGARPLIQEILLKHFPVGSVSDYKAEFLWPHTKGSVQEAGYEFANAKTEDYRGNWWLILRERIESEAQAMKKV